MAEKTHQATARRLREARRQGEVARSADVITTVQFIALLALIAGAGPFALDQLHQLLDAAQQAIAAHDPGEQIGAVLGAVSHVLLLVFVALGVAVALDRKSVV